MCLKTSGTNQYSTTIIDNTSTSSQSFCVTSISPSTDIEYYTTNDLPPTPGHCSLQVPANLAAETKSNTSIDLTWSAVNIATNYSIERSTDPNFISPAPTTVLNEQLATSPRTFSNTGLTPGTTYYYRVNAKTATSTSEWSTPPASATTTIDYTLTIIAGAGGTVNAGGTYAGGSVQTITATPNNSFYTFTSWTGDAGCSGIASHTITMNSNKTCTANFSLASGWMNGLGGTVLSGKYIRNTNNGSDTWDNAQSICSAIGGRVPSITELRSIYDNRTAYGIASTNGYWTSVQRLANTAYLIAFNSGNQLDDPKTSIFYIRCIAD